MIPVILHANTSSSLLLTRLGLKIKMKVNVTPRQTHTHRDLGRIGIIHRPIACVRVWGRKVLVGNLLSYITVKHADKSRRDLSKDVAASKGATG
jgi:hypothetical protein